MVDARYPRVAAGFTRVLRGVEPTQWSSPTPCTDWDVTALVGHVIETHRRVRSIVVPDLERAPVEGGDLLALWAEATADIEAAVADPSLAAREIPGRTGAQTFGSMVEGLLTIDTLCHTWDLARATGQDESLDPDAVEMAHGALTKFDALMRVPGGFGPALEAPAGASPQTAFLRFAGRDA